MVKFLIIASLILGVTFIYFRSKALAESAKGSDQNKRAEKKIYDIETELKIIGWWSDKPIEPDKLNFAEAFGADKLAYDQWLQYVFVPRVRSIIKENGDLPNESSLGVKAMREWDYMDRVDKAQRLIRLLYEFDDICNKK